MTNVQFVAINTLLLIILIELDFIRKDLRK